MPTHAVFAVAMCALAMTSSVDAATVGGQRANDKGTIRNAVGLIGEGFAEFGQSIIDGYREMGDDIMAVVPWNSEGSRAYATSPETIAPVKTLPEVEVDIDMAELLPEELPPSENRAAASPIIYTGERKTETFITNITQGMEEDEIKTLVASMLDGALGTALADLKEDESGPASFLDGLTARGTVDLTNADIKGLEYLAEKAAPLYVRDSQSGIIRVEKIIAGNQGGVSGDFSVGDDLSVKNKLIVTGGATFESGFTSEGLTTLDANLTVAGNTTLGDDSLSDSLNIKATTTIHAGILPSANNSWDIGSQETALKDLYASGSIYTQDITILGTCTGCGGGSGEWTDGGSVIYLADSGDDVGIGTTTPAGTLGVAGSLFISGDATLGDSESDVFTSNASSTFTGKVQLGDSGADLITFGGGIQGRNSANGYIIDPTNNDELSFGTPANSFKDFYSSGTIHVNQAILPTSNGLTDLGTSSSSFRDIYASGTVHLGFNTSDRIPQFIIDATEEFVTIGSSSLGAADTGFVVGNDYSSYFAANMIIGDSEADELTVNASTTFLGKVMLGEAADLITIGGGIQGRNSAFGYIIDPTNNDELSFGTPTNSFKDFYASGTIFANQAIIPTSAGVTDLGVSSSSFRNIYASGTVHLGFNTEDGNTPILIIDNANDTVAFGSSSMAAASDTSFAVSNAYDTYFGGSMIIGDSNIENLRINASTTFNSDAFVTTNNTFDLGRPNLSFAGVYASGTSHFGYTSELGTLLTVDAAGGGVGIASSSIDGQNFNFAVGNDASAYFGGGVTIGDDTNDTLTINSAIGSDMLPAQTATLDLGSAAFSWQDLYASGTVQLGNPSTGNIPIISTLSTNDGYVGISSSSLNTSVEGAKLQLGGGLFMNGIFTIDTSNAMAGNGLYYSAAGSLISQPANSDGTVAFTLAVQGGDIDQGSFMAFTTSTSDGSAQKTLLEIGYSVNSIGEFTTTTFFSGVQDVAGASAFEFDTETAMTSSSGALDRTLFTVSNGGTSKFHIGAGGNVYAANSFIANSTEFGIGDLAEYVDLSPGSIISNADVVQPDPENPGKFRLVEEAYASNVGGIISNTAAFVMGARGENRGALALAGLVYAHVSDESGAIEVGDMLVTASEPGHLMKYDPARAAGANAVIVATALEPHETGLGTIKTLVRAAANATSSSTLTIVEAADGTLGSEQALDLDNQAIINVASIHGMGETWSVNPEGILTTREVKAEQFTVVKPEDDRFASIGTGIIHEGDAVATVSSIVVNQHSRIFITFRTTLNGRTYHVADIVDNESFNVKVTYAAEQSLLFDYWIVNVEGEDEITPNVAPVLTEDDVAAITAEEDIQNAIDEFEEEVAEEEVVEEPIAEEEAVDTEEVVEEAVEEVIEEAVEEVVEAEEVVEDEVIEEEVEEVVEELPVEEEVVEQVEEVEPEPEVVVEEEIEPDPVVEEPEPETTTEETPEA